MNIGGFIKRLLPFVAAFAVGVFVASFFVDLTKPRFGGGPRWRAKRYHEMQRLRAENEELRNEVLRLKNDRNLCMRYVDPTTGDETFFPVPVRPSHPELLEAPGLVPPVPPPVPAAPRNR